MTPRALLLGVGSATGVLASRSLDGLALLPGVHESAAVRSAVLAPGWTVASLVACLLLGHAVSRLVRPSPWLAGCALLAGQSLVLAAPELIGRAEAVGTSGAPQGEHVGAVAAAIAVQLVLAMVTVSTAILVLRLLNPLGLRRLPRLAADAGLSAPPYLVVLKHRRGGGGGGRAPPAGCVHPPTPT